MAPGVVNLKKKVDNLERKPIDLHFPKVIKLGQQKLFGWACL